MYKLDILMFDNGERYPILMGEDGFPHFYVTLYATTMLREGANKSYGTRAFNGNPLILND